ncbi:MAG TPA: hypothetical protein VHC22_23585 [Pirellulales bacterium]|nr:hypothetical protein [Pirellulales bacterium]
MKAKGKFDSAQLKSFVVNHVEKVVFGGFVVAFLLISWSAFKLKPYDKTPAELKKLADDVSQQVEAKTPPDKFTDLPSVPDFKNLGAVGPAPVNPQFFAVKPLSLPYEERQERRKEPQFFVLEGLMGFPEYGGIAIGEEGAVSRSGSNFGGGGMEVAGIGGGAMMSGYGPTSRPPDMMSNPMAGSEEQIRQMQQMQSRQQAQQGMMQNSMANMGSARGRMRASRAKRRPTAKVEAPKPAPRRKPQSTEKIVLTQAPGNSKVEGRYWICLVGALPYWKQLNEYQTTFRDASLYDVKHDYPRYDLPRIERAEVRGNDLGDWQELDVVSAAEDFDKWAAEYPEVVDPRFVDPHLTEPLPPLVFANHDKEKVNHPLTKVAEQKQVVAEAVKKRARHSLTGGGSSARNRNTGQPGMQSAAMANPYGAYSAGGAGGSAGPMVEHRLFRFFDFTVEPNKTYRYRVKLVLVNPNAGVPPRYLESYDFGNGLTREAEWSEPSPPIPVIAGNRLLAGTVTPGRTEPTAKVLAKQFDARLASEIRRIFDISRGSIMNESGIKIGLPQDAGKPAAEPTEVDFETNAVVLDMFGGDKLPGAKSRSLSDQAKVPGHILVLDSDGQLKTLVQATDAGMYETEAEEAKAQAAAAEGKRPPGPGSPAAGGNAGFENFDEINTNSPRRRR